MDLSLAEIRAFNATLKRGSFSSAADELGVSQPAITAQIRKLESRFERPLLERFSRGVRPTAFGHKLHRITSQYADLEEAISTLSQPQPDQGRYQLKVVTASPLMFMPLVAEFNQRYPEATLTINSTTTDECRSQVLNREADIGLFPMPEEEPGVSKINFDSHRLNAVVPVNHPLATESELSVHQLIDHPLVFRKKDCCTQGLVDRAFSAARLQPSARVWMDARYDMCEAVVYGLGIGFALSNDIRTDPRYRIIPVTEATEPVIEHLVWLKPRTDVPGIREFVQLALENRCSSLPSLAPTSASLEVAV